MPRRDGLIVQRDCLSRFDAASAEIRERGDCEVLECVCPEVPSFLVRGSVDVLDDFAIRGGLADNVALDPLLDLIEHIGE